MPESPDIASLSFEQARAHLDLFGDKAIYLAESVDFVLELTG